MRNLNNTNNASQVYECVIDGIVYRGSKDYIQQVIKEDRENHN